MNKKKKIEIECTHCNGTGLYKGFAEKEGCAVICYNCNGTGKQIYFYTAFKKRREASGVRKVYLKNQGYVLYENDIIKIDTGEIIDYSKEGVTYEEWKNGKKPKLIKMLGCPMHSDQGECKRIQGFEEECTRLNGGYINMFTKCKMYKNCQSCWDRYFNVVTLDKGDYSGNGSKNKYIKYI